MVRRHLLTSALGLCVALASLLTACGGDAKPAPSAAVRTIAGLPQRAFELGSPDAPAVATIYADPFCAGPNCTFFTGNGLTRVIQRYVRPGRLRLLLRPVSTPGYPPHGLRETYAASLQSHGWDYVLTFWSGQDAQVDPIAVARRIPRLDVSRLRTDAASKRVSAAIARSTRRSRARDAGVPSLFFDPPGDGAQNVRRVALQNPDAAVTTLGRLLDRH